MCALFIMDFNSVVEVGAKLQTEMNWTKKKNDDF